MPRPELPLVLLTLSAVWCAAQHMNSGSVAPSSYIWREVKSKEKMGLLFVSAVWRREGVGSNGTVLKCVRRRFGGVVVRCSSTDHSGEFARGGSRNDTATVDRAVVEQIERNVAEAPERQVGASLRACLLVLFLQGQAKRQDNRPPLTTYSFRWTGGCGTATGCEKSLLGCAAWAERIEPGGDHFERCGGRKLDSFPHAFGKEAEQNCRDIAAGHHRT